MIRLEQYSEAAQAAVHQTATDFHLEAKTTKGVLVSAPCTYQIREPGFRPFRDGKASAAELQAALDDTVLDAENRGIDLGIEGHESIRKLALQLGLGIDCSNFVYRAVALAHQNLGIDPYERAVFRDGSEVRSLHTQGGSWSTLNEHTHDDLVSLQTADLLSIEWLQRVLGKDPEFIIGSKHIAADAAVNQIDIKALLPGDILGFKKAGQGTVSHVAVIESVDASEGQYRANFWHSWHTRDLESGLRADTVTFSGDSYAWSHAGLADKTRYEDYVLLRPRLMADACQQI